MKRHLVLILIGLIITNINLLAQDGRVQNDTVKNGRTLSFKVIGIGDTTKANISGFVLDCNDNSLVGGTLISFNNLKTGLTTDFCCTDSSGFFKIRVDYGLYNIKFNTLGYYDYKINNQSLGSGYLILSTFCIHKKPEFEFNKPIILDNCYQRIDKK